ncbi:hypothetical protein DENIS_0973 [Desulfonema ishimotonii]|uniref:Uncharacterized protein n=1 Tax=Desulfonema ishimotonii TaxID=45657 RepID=A0A401FST6_9BACT|nr:hypothetical protein DENIS_0973 [Desulfonema ishimotonii]
MSELIGYLYYNKTKFTTVIVILFIFYKVIFLKTGSTINSNWLNPIPYAVKYEAVHIRNDETGRSAETRRIRYGRF